MNVFFEIALKESKKAYKKNEIPVGCVITKNNKMIAKAHNNRQKKSNILGHAEILCILKAEKKNKDWRLDGYNMYVTLEPCDMCKKIIEESRIENVYYMLENNDINKLKYKNIIQTNDCADLKEDYDKLFKSFFKKLRK